MTILRFAPALIAALGLSACAAALEPTAMGRYGDGLGADAPLASLPASAGRVVAVRRVAYANGASQRIVLDGPRAMAGENSVTVQTLTVGGPAVRDDVLRIGPPTDAAIAAEMETQFPALRMTIATEVERNALGPFGYAVGSKGPLACVYAWQYLAPAQPSSLIGGLSGGGGPVSIRVRLCRDRPVTALVEDIRHLSLTRSDTGAATSGPVGGGVAGDALEAAIGPLATTASDVGPSDRRPSAEPTADAPPPRRAARAHLHRVARRDRPGPGAHPLRRDILPEGPRGAAAALVPPIPLPSGFGTGPVAPRATPASSSDNDAMPLPR